MLEFKWLKHLLVLQPEQTGEEKNEMEEPEPEKPQKTSLKSKLFLIFPYIGFKLVKSVDHEVIYLHLVFAEKPGKVQFQSVPADISFSTSTTDDAYDFNTDFK